MREIIQEVKTKYSNKGPVKMDDIPISDTELALQEFSEGSVSLEKCLRAMWQRNLKTHACFADVEEEYDIAYITMQENIDLFSYLSPVIIDDDMIQIDLEGDRQTIRFAGNKPRIEAAILNLIRDIQKGKKRNGEQIKKKIGKPFPEEWVKEYEARHIKRNGLMKRLA